MGKVVIIWCRGKVSVPFIQVSVHFQFGGLWKNLKDTIERKEDGHKENDSLAILNGLLAVIYVGEEDGVDENHGKGLEGNMTPGISLNSQKWVTSEEETKVYLDKGNN